MDKKLYELLNDTETTIEEHDKEVFTELDKRRMKMNINKKIKAYKVPKKGLIVASALILGLGTLTTTPVLAHMSVAFKSIAESMGIEKGLENYTTVLNQSITKNGVTLQLNEVILNNDEIIISSTATAEEELEVVGIRYFTDVYINNKLVTSGRGGGSWQVDDYTEQGVMTSSLNDSSVDLSGELDIKVVFEHMSVNEKNKLGKWIFEFKATGDELKADTTSTEIGYTFTLENGQKMTLDSYVTNDLGPKIYFYGDEGGTDYDLLLKGHDDLGNEVAFYMSHYGHIEDIGVFKLSSVNGEITKALPDESKVLTLTPYAVAFPKESGKLSNDFKVVGEVFNIDLETLKR